ncbi:hypothetical protein CLV63_12385 [Murinocardiopsis flavida]|uniref:Pyrroloquinoline-quinone binding quinoprotein n=1 Tax=Murinocardiopsis flavida TaxID=645275 RepID=A0A2P8CZA5_9ACTN|nr:hypothetical protein [Murinocardiopsis flavida]PSK90256.1 hypothetical protein CLV63_12385 [Murinocardiopsis flavida]
MRRGAKQQKPHKSPVTLVIAPDERHAEITFKDDHRWVGGAGPKETRRAALDVAVEHAVRLGRPVRIHAADASSEWQLTATPTGVVRAAEAGTSGGGRRSGLLVAAVAVLVIGGLAGTGTLAYRMLPPGWPESADAATTPESASFNSRPAPPGFTEDALWKIPLAPGSRPSVAEDGSVAAIVGADGKIAAIGPDGVRKWSEESPLPPAEVKSGLRINGGADDFSVSLSDSESLWVWASGGGDPERFELPSGGQVSYGGSAPMVLTEGAAFVPSDGELVEVDTPQGTAGLLAKGDSVLAASANGPWSWVRPAGKAREVEPVPPDQATRLERVLAASDDYVIVRWAAAGGGRTILAVHDSQDGSVASSTAVAEQALVDARWVVGDGVGAYGPLLVDLEAGEGRLLGGFRPTSAAGPTLYGERKGVAVAVGRDGSPENLETGAARPWGLLDGHAIVMADDDLYALTPA